MSLNLTDSSGNQICVGGVCIIIRGPPHMSHEPYSFQFQPITTAAAPDYDIILGMAFCEYCYVSALAITILIPAAVRNVYLLINYGDFVDGTTNKAPPFAQLLSLTNAAAAHLEFVQARLDGVDTTGMQVFTDQPVSSPAASNNDGRQTRMIVIYGVIAGSLILVFFTVTACIIMKRRRRHHSNTRSNFAADTGLSYNHTAYHSLQDAPSGEPNQVQGYYTEVGQASMYDPYAETTRARTVPTHEVDYSGPPPKYEDRDPWQGR